MAVNIHDDLVYTKGYKYQLHAGFSVTIPALGQFHKDIICDFIILKGDKMTLLKGYAWDGASGPTIDTKSSMRAGAIHDALYKLIRQGVLPEGVKGFADCVLEDVCILDGMWEWRAKLWHRAVNEFANAAADPRNKKKVYIAP